MDDLISRKMAVDAVYGRIRQIGYEHNASVLSIRQTIRDLPSAERWISCSERLPRQGQEVICQCRANMIKVLKLDACGDWYQDAEHCYMSGFVVAWMPLPEPYKGEQDG